jgi:hypothetical protein
MADEFGNLPDYHQTFYRNYDPEIGRFTGVDLLSGETILHNGTTY